MAIPPIIGAYLGALVCNGSPVIGDVSWSTNHAAIAARSYVCPSHVSTGSTIT